MKFGYYFAKDDRLDGNCVRLAVGAQVLWQRSICAGFTNPSSSDGVRICERPDGSIVKQIVVHDFFVEDGGLWVRIVD